MDIDKVATADKVTKTIRDYGKGGLTTVIAIYFLMQMNEKMDAQAMKIEQMTNKQAEMNAVVVQMRGEVTNLWSKYNEAMQGKEMLSKEGSKAYFEIMDRINQVEHKIPK